MLRWIAVGLLASIASQATAGLLVEHDLEPGKSFSAYLVSYPSSGLKVHALVAVPNSPTPERGYPVVVANHGYVPDPRNYGITADGRNSRPGDYYRSVPELYTSRGFLVVMPDYRGHNSSEGFELIEGQAKQSITPYVEQYADDVVALLDYLDDIEEADTDNIFFWSHSMGGAVAIRALLATDVVDAASFWSTMAVDDLAPRLTELDGPVVIHHALGDPTTPFANSDGFARALSAIGHPCQLHGYDTDDHFFGPNVREQAAERDARLFRQIIGR